MQDAVQSDTENIAGDTESGEKAPGWNVLNTEAIKITGRACHSTMKGCMDHIASEMLEAQYDWATGFLNGTEKGKPVGMASELADMVILIAHAAHIAGIDLDKALDEKVRWCNENPK